MSWTLQVPGNNLLSVLNATGKFPIGLNRCASKPSNAFLQCFPLTPVLCQGFRLLHTFIYTEDVNYNACWNIGETSFLDVVYSRRPTHDTAFFKSRSVKIVRKNTVVLSGNLTQPIKSSLLCVNSGDKIQPFVCYSRYYCYGA